MRLLLDTSAVLHVAAGSLSPPAAAALGAGGLAVVSPVIPWELAIKVSLLTPDRQIAAYPGVTTVW